MRCPYCKSNNDRVVDSRTSGEADSIRRRRECLECAGRSTTYEKVGETPLHAAGRKVNNVGVLAVLVQAGADFNAIDSKGRSVFKVANGPKNRKWLKDMGAEK